MPVVHLIASGFYGGPERQILGLCRELAPEIHSQLLLFSEGGRCRDFLRHATEAGIDATELAADAPRLVSAIHEIAQKCDGAAILFCHGYKASLLGRPAARRLGIPAVAVSRGWTSENWRVRAYTAADKAHLKCMDHVIAVSDGQAQLVRRAGVAREKLTVIRNSARLDAFAGSPTTAARAELIRPFRGYRPSRVVLAAGRFSPEKGFEVLIDAAAHFLRADPNAGLVIYGDGDLRPQLEGQIRKRDLGGRVALPGFTTGLDALTAAADVVALSSHSEGLPNVLLEASAAGVPVAATRVGGVPEVVADGVTGLLSRAGCASSLAGNVTRLLSDVRLRLQYGDAGRERMRSLFTFAAQAEAYRGLIARLGVSGPMRVAA